MNIHASVNARVNTSIDACMHTRVCIRVHIYVHRRIHVRTHTHTHRHEYVCKYTHTGFIRVYTGFFFAVLSAVARSRKYSEKLLCLANTLPTRDSTAFIIVAGQFRANAPSAARACATPSGVAANAARRQLGQAAAEPVCVQYCEKLGAANSGVAGGRVGDVCGERGPEHAAGRSPAGIGG